MKTTPNYNLNLIEKTDEILKTWDSINENFTKIDTELGDYETTMTNLIEGDGV